MRYLLMFFILCGSLWAQDMSPQENGTANADSLLDQAITAAEEEYYQRALELLKQGQESFPLDSRFLSQRGDMLLEQGLYELALQNYLQALDLNPQGPQIIKQIALTLGYLDRNDDAVDYLLQLMDFESFREGAVEDLAWVYYKLHRLKQGETLLLQELESGFNRRMAHTLGTIYAGLYNYEESQRYYMESIDHALAEGQSYFASVAYYNLSILEYRFYNFEKSLEMTELSLEQQDRGGGHQAKAEILEMTMDFSAARQEYIRADEMMDNPLAKKDLARLYCDWGFFEEALQYCRSVENQEDTRWMYSYGIDGQEMDRDMAELYRDIYGGIVNREALLPQSTLWKSVKTWGQRIYFHILSLYHGSRYRSLSKEAGEKQLEQGNNIQGWWILAQGSRGFSATAMEYFRLARQEEVARVASAAPWYDLEIAREAGNTSTLKNLLPAFDAHWEAWAVAETLKALVDHLPRNSRDSVVYRQQLYLMNPGALLVLGDALPFTLQFSSSEDLPEKRITRQITGILRRSGNLNGLRGSLGSTSQDAYSFNLMIQLNAQGFNWYLMDQENQSLAEGYEALNLESSREISEALRNMLLEIYNGVVG